MTNTVYKMALIDDKGVVVNTILADATYTPPKDIRTVVFLSEVIDDVNQKAIFEGKHPGPGDYWDGTRFSKPDLPKSVLLDRAKKARNKRGKRGIIFAKLRVPVSTETVNSLKEVIDTFSYGELSKVSFKIGLDFLELSKEDAEKLLQQVRSHLQKCFETEMRAVKEINAGTITKAAQVRAIFDEAFPEN